MGLKFEERQTEALEREALLDVQQEYPKYFDALRQHPRQLIGTEVPSVTGEGMERLKDSNDARDWQDGVKKLLIDEVASRVDASREQLSGVYSTVHASIDMFRNNHDLIPGTKGFDRELADAVAQAAQPYELRAKDKLVGYSIPIQPVINAVRQQLANTRGQSAGAAAATTAAQQRAAEQQRAANGGQVFMCLMAGHGTICGQWSVRGSAGWDQQPGWPVVRR